MFRSLLTVTMGLPTATKLTGAVHLDAGLSLLKALTLKPKPIISKQHVDSEHVDFEHCRRAINYGLSLPPDGGRPLNDRVFKNHIKLRRAARAVVLTAEQKKRNAASNARGYERRTHDKASIAAHRERAALLAQMTTEEKVRFGIAEGCCALALAADSEPYRCVRFSSAVTGGAQKDPESRKATAAARSGVSGGERTQECSEPGIPSTRQAHRKGCRTRC